jgi:hypothetical protein
MLLCELICGLALVQMNGVAREDLRLGKLLFDDKRRHRISGFATYSLLQHGLVRPGNWAKGEFPAPEFLQAYLATYTGFEVLSKMDVHSLAMILCHLFSGAGSVSGANSDPGFRPSIPPGIHTKLADTIPRSARRSSKCSAQWSRFGSGSWTEALIARARKLGLVNGVELADGTPPPFRASSVSRFWLNWRSLSAGTVITKPYEDELRRVQIGDSAFAARFYAQLGNPHAQ